MLYCLSQEVGLLLRYSDKRGNVVAPCLDEIEIVYVAFDILYKGSLHSIVGLPLEVVLPRIKCRLRYPVSSFKRCRSIQTTSCVTCMMYQIKQ